MTRFPPSLMLAINRRLLDMWPLDKILADLAEDGGVHMVANAVRAALTGGGLCERG